VYRGEGPGDALSTKLPHHEAAGEQWSKNKWFSQSPTPTLEGSWSEVDTTEVPSSYGCQESPLGPRVLLFGSRVSPKGLCVKGFVPSYSMIGR
jgi:hypothetical protein